MANCKECGKEFQPKNKKGIFCSDKCRQKDYRKSMAKLAKLAREVQMEVEKRNNPLINAARGRDASGINEDELLTIAKNATKNSRQSKEFKEEVWKVDNPEIKTSNETPAERVKRMMEEQRKKLQNNQK